MGSGPGGRGGLADRFARRVISDGLVASGETVVVALSGGLDSSVLLHLLRFTPGLATYRLVAGHFDHGMRPESGEDRRWVRGLCRAWDVPLWIGCAESGLGSEEDAREARYEFLHAVREKEEARWLLTGHHSDDQSETVLFRIIRGTGLRGLAGIPETRDPGVYRPLLPFSRSQLSDYALDQGVPFLQDRTNSNLAYPRNFLRHRILPQLREGPAPGVGESLIRLARLARENEDGWRSLYPHLLDGVLVEENGDIFIVRSGLLAYHPAVQSRLLREIFARSGIELDEAGTRAAVEFTRTGASGGGLSLPAGFRLVREFDGFRLEGTRPPVESERLVIPGPESGSGEVSVGGVRFQVEWGPDEPHGCDATCGMQTLGLDFPLVMRGWEPGDRIQLPYGTKKLKKLFAEARIPMGQRSLTPVLYDSGGRALWVVGVAVSTLVQGQKGPGTFFFGIRNVDT